MNTINKAIVVAIAALMLLVAPALGDTAVAHVTVYPNAVYATGVAHADDVMVHTDIMAYGGHVDLTMLAGMTELNGVDTSFAQAEGTVNAPLAITNVKAMAHEDGFAISKVQATTSNGATVFGGAQATENGISTVASVQSHYIYGTGMGFAYTNIGVATAGVVGSSTWNTGIVKAFAGVTYQIPA